MDETMDRQHPPIPTSISAEAQRYLAAPSTYGTEPEPTDLRDTDAWLRYIDGRNAVITQAVAAMAPADLPVQHSSFELDGVTTYVLRPDHVADSTDTPIYLDLHGGALILGGGDACLAMATPYSLGRNMITWSLDYRTPPLHPYPAALDDCVAVYRKALDERGPENVFVGGGSAGGNLAAALLLRAKDEHLPMPAGLVLITPEVDLTESGDTFQTLLGIDNVLTDSLMNANLLYAGDHDLADPYLSPLFGDLSGLPPTFLQSGTRDLFLSNTVRMHRRLRNAGVEAELHVWEAMPHGGFAGAPEDLELAMEISRFLESHRP